MKEIQQEMVIELVCGNQGALQIVLALARTYGTEMLNGLYILGTRGPDIWDMYKRECGQDLAVMHAHIISKVRNREYTQTQQD